MTPKLWDFWVMLNIEHLEINYRINSQLITIPKMGVSQNRPQFWAVLTRI